MESKEILSYCVDKGLLIDPGLLSLLSETNDLESSKLIIERLRNHTHQRIITKTLFEQNKEKMSEFFLTLSGKDPKNMERLKIKLGLQIEISKENFSSSSLKEVTSREGEVSLDDNLIKVDFSTSVSNKKIEVGDFVKNMRDRFNQTRKILQDHSELDELVSINKLSRGRKSSIIGIIYSKSVTKNKNILMEVEDFTGRTRVLVNQNRPEIYKQAEDIALDSVIGFSGSGNNEIFFANGIVFPDASVSEKKYSLNEEYALFIGDVHYGSKLFMGDQFSKFIDYLNGKTGAEEVKKIKYLFIVGDLIAGVGVYPGQNHELVLDDLVAQFQGFAELLGKIRGDIKIIISPGNHDGVRLLEPQPPFDEKYAWPLYNMKNVIITGNPAAVNIAASEDFSGFDLLTYHGFSYPFYANNTPSLIESGMNSPDKIMAYLLKNRHLAPTYSSSQYIPLEEDSLVIKNVPDIFVSGHTHKCAVTSYNNILLISVASWEKETEYQKRVGNKPDFCKVPMINLKTREIKLLDFE